MNISGSDLATYGFIVGSGTTPRKVECAAVWDEFSNNIVSGEIERDPDQCMQIILMLEYIPSVESDKELKIIAYVEEIINLVRMLECDNDKMIIARLGFVAGCYYGITDCDEDFNQSFAACVENEQYSTVIEIISVHYSDYSNRCV